MGRYTEEKWTIIQEETARFEEEVRRAEKKIPSFDEIDALGVHSRINRSEKIAAGPMTIAELERLIPDARTIDEAQGGEEVLLDLLGAEAAAPADDVRRAHAESVGRLVGIDTLRVGLLVPKLALQQAPTR